MKNKINFGETTLTRFTLFIGLLMLLSVSSLFSQKIKKSPYRLGVGIGSHVSGNAHGSIYDVYGSIYNGNSVFSAGPCIQKRTNSICGARIAYNYMLTGKEDFSKSRNEFNDCEKLQLYFFSYLQYIHNSPLSFNSVRREEITSRSNDNRTVDFEKLKFSTVEGGFGFGLNVNLSKQLVWGNYMAFGTYYHINYMGGMYAERISPVLVIGTTLRLKLF